ncbi:hypothetical protein ACF9IK_20430 [Kitasatospora hibisci]|uniref:hypothetical protein n=1 Tax=Kitasatospora hibisci TaxID=3369522 RepID=UPI003754B20D
MAWLQELTLMGSGFPAGSLESGFGARADLPPMAVDVDLVPARRTRLRSRLSVLGEHDFRWFFVGYATSLFGSSMAPVAVAFAVLDDGGGGTDLGWVMAARVLPIVLVMPAGGVVADRLGSRRVMLAADVPEDFKSSETVVML